VAEVIPITGLSNLEFLDRYAAPGRIGLAGGTALVDRLITRAQRHLDSEHRWSRWSHAFLFQGRRLDGQQWVIESDLDFSGRHIRLGVQENRVAKFADESTYTTLAILDLGLDDATATRVLTEGLELAATHTEYSVRELVGTLFAMRHPTWRARTNLLARDRCLFCSALVRHCFRAVGIDLLPGVEVKNTAPEDLARSPRLQTMWLRQRAVAKPLRELVTIGARRLTAGVRWQRRKLKRQREAT